MNTSVRNAGRQPVQKPSPLLERPDWLFPSDYREPGRILARDKRDDSLLVYNNAFFDEHDRNIFSDWV